MPNLPAARPSSSVDGVLSLLTLRLDGRYLIIAFAGGGAIRLDIDQLVCQLEDLGESWPTVWRPAHSQSEAGGGSSGGGRP